MTKHNIVIIAVVVMLSFITTSCGSIDGAVDKITDSIDNALDDGNNNESSTSSEGEEGEDGDYTETDGETYEDRFYEGSEEGVRVFFDDFDDVPADRYFMGTFKQKYSQNRCPGFPAIARLYSYGTDVIYLDDNKGNLISVAEIFPDETFDFVYYSVDKKFGEDTEHACTCSIETSEWYPTEWMCTCTGDTACTLHHVGI